jgi:hypothetical protein
MFKIRYVRRDREFSSVGRNLGRVHNDELIVIQLVASQESALIRQCSTLWMRASLGRSEAAVGIPHRQFSP